MQSALNQTKGATAGSSKIDCAKECPCGVPVIPVPDQWLEVMVTGGFKVWHIIFIIIAFVVTLIVVYCCFHRCRIPRTKQEIEADLMRTNIANKFRDYLQELPNEPTSFLEALKKVQDMEEKSEKDDAQLAKDAGARKRLGWLKLKGKGDKDAGGGGGAQKAKTDEQDPDEKLALPAAEPQKDVIPEPEPPVPQPPPEPVLAPPNLDNAVLNLPASGALGDGADQGEQEPKTRPARRRKQKPNLSRTKRAKERWNGDHPDGQAISHEVEPQDEPPKPHSEQDIEKGLARKAPLKRPPKHHTHQRVRIEPKGPPDV